MNGAELVIQTAAASGVDVCFANPGTTEMPLVNALDRVGGVHGVLCLFEGVATGAADGYGRMAGRPALTLVHLGPGLANGVANLHNARRARTPLVNLVGDHATWHRPADPPLNMDLEGLAGTVSGWVCRVESAHSLAAATVEALAAAACGQSATLVLPHDLQLAIVEDVPAPPPVVAVERPNARLIETAAGLLRRARRPALLLGGQALLRDGLAAAARVRAATGCDLWADGFAGRIELGRGLPLAPRVPYLPEAGLAALAPYDLLLLVDAALPTAFFGWPQMPSFFVRPDETFFALDGAYGDRPLRLADLPLPLANGGDIESPRRSLWDAVGALTALAEALSAPQRVAQPDPPGPAPASVSGPLTPQNIGATLAALQPEEAIIMNEGVTTGRAYGAFAVHAPPHTMLSVTGGAIGGGLPCAVGAAIACPDRRVIGLQADGSALYTLQALWTAARERLHITTLLCSNRGYKILDGEQARAGVTPGPIASSMTDLGSPAIGWAEVARGLGVPAVTVTAGEELARELRIALAEPGPRLIEMIVAG